MSSLSSLISYGDGDGDGNGNGNGDSDGDNRDLVDFELEYVGNKFNGGVLSFYEDEYDDNELQIIDYRLQIIDYRKIIWSIKKN